MKCIFTKPAMAVLTAAMLVACTKTDMGDNPGGGTDGDKVAAVIQAGIGGQNQTRAHDAVWDENDAIGLAMLDEEGDDVINEVYNYHYVTSASLGVFEPKSSAMMIYFPSDGSLVTFRAYYPYYSELDENMFVPIDVSSQSALPQIDFMSADHITGRSKEEPVVRLHFRHRLTKLIFKLSGDNPDAFGDLSKCTVSARGMKTTGTYELLAEQLDIDNDSEQVITFGRHDSPASERYGIVLPRAAGAGVEFDFNFANGAKYTAKMGSTLELLPGYEYTFHINLSETPAEVSADIEPWVEGPARYYDAMQATIDAGESVNVDPGTEMDVFITGDPTAEYSGLGTFVYNADGKWYPRQDIYWESIPYDPAYMRSSIVMEAPLNNTQAGDWLVSEPVTVARNTGAKFVLSRAVSKLFVELHSDQFSDDELEGATITLPDYFTGSYLFDGEFVPGTTRSDILMEDDSETGDRVAIFQPQSVSAGGDVVSIELDGRTYVVEAETGGYTFEAGIAYKFVVSLNKAGLSISVTVMDWEPGPVENLDALELGTVAGVSHNVNVGDKIDLYLLEGAEYEYISTYTYQNNLRWGGAPTIYWDDIPAGTSYFIARMDEADALNSTQLPDVLLSEPTRGYHYEGIDFELNHAAAKTVVSLVSSIYSESQIADARIVLPGYTTGGSFDGARLVGGTTTGNINVERTGTFTGEAIFEPQQVAAGDDAVVITIGGNTFTATAPAGGINFEAGYATTLVVRIDENGLSIGVTVNDWNKGPEIGLETLKIDVVAGETDGVNPGEELDIFTGINRDPLATYTYNGNNDWTGPTIYWEDLDDPTTFYASIDRQAAYNNTMPDDILLSGPVTAPYGSAVDFTLSHAVAQVAVQLSSDGSFSDAELAAMDITLPGYVTGGTYNNGVFVPGQETNTPVRIRKDAGAQSKSGLAFVQPQTIRAGRPVVNVATGTRDYTATYASDIEFRAGYTTVLIVKVTKTAIEISARVVDWQKGQEIQLVANTIDIGAAVGETGDFFIGKTIYLYDMTKGNVYPYSYIDEVWSGQRLFWDDYASTGLNMAAVYYPAGFTPARAGATTFAANVSDDQSTGWDRYDLLMAYDGYSAGTYGNFDYRFRHVMSRVKVILTSDEFTDADFQGATLELNNFILNGTANLAQAVVTPSTTREGTLIPQADTNNGREFSAIVQPRNTPAGTQIVSITLPGYPGETFTAAYPNELVLEPGKVTTITVELRRTGINLSATLETWGNNDGGTITIQ